MQNVLSALAYEPSATLVCPEASEGLSFTDRVEGHDWRVAYRIIVHPNLSNLDGPIVLYAGGSGEQMHKSESKCRKLSEAYECHFVVFDLPGPESHTKTQEWFMYKTQDARYAAIRAVHDAVIKAGFTNMYVWGRSLGSCLACHLASVRTLRGVVLEMPFASMQVFLDNAPSHVGGGFQGMIRQMLEDLLWYADPYDAKHWVEKGLRGAPSVFVLYSKGDTLLPPVHAAIMYETLHKAKVEVEIRSIEGEPNHTDPVETYPIPALYFHARSLSSSLLDMVVGMSKVQRSNSSAAPAEDRFVVEFERGTDVRTAENLERVADQIRDSAPSGAKVCDPRMEVDSEVVRVSWLVC